MGVEMEIINKEKLLSAINLIKDNAEMAIKEEFENPDNFKAYNQGRYDAMKRLLIVIEEYLTEEI